ncbi:unnamed protein product [Musa acuminata subsp. burmannicoides]
MAVKVYGKPQAVCPQRVMHCLVEKGVPFEFVLVDIDAMEHKRPEYMEKHPFGQVPFIADGDFELFESRAIVRYFAAKYADRGPNLLGRTAEERAKVEQWLDVEAISYSPCAFTIVFNLFLLPIRGLPGNKGEAVAAMEKLDKILEVYEKQLSRTKYLAGDEFTLADLTHIPVTRYIVEHCGLAYLLDDKPHAKAWWEDVSRRPAWKKVMSFEEEKEPHMMEDQTQAKSTAVAKRRVSSSSSSSSSPSSRFKRVCVFCGSSTGKKKGYQLAAIQLGKELVVERNIDLVYGGGSVGLMGLVSQAVFDGGRHVLGIIPRTLMPKEITGETIGEVQPVAGMHQRKAEMARQADAFVALPAGGYGTLEELLEVITWAQLGIHDKPVGLLNVEGYYNTLLSFIDKAVDEGFISPDARHIIISAQTAHELLSKLEVRIPIHRVCIC